MQEKASVMEEKVREVLYETRHHASRPYTPNYPPQQGNDVVKGGFLSRGVSQLKEKWSKYRNPRKLKKLASLFISLRSERVAVASGNQITILKKDNDYQEPSGTFTCSSHCTFTYGAWSESLDVLGVADDTDTLYFIKSNGEEITRITKRHFKVSLPIIGLIAQDDSASQRSYLCGFSILTSDGSLHHIEIGQEPSASISSACSSNNGSALMRQFPQNVFCFDYHQELSLLIVVGCTAGILLTSCENSGSSCLSLWRRCRNLDLEQLSFTQFEGLYCKPKGYVGQLAYPKVLISPQSNFISTLDVTGCLHLFKLDKECGSLSNFAWRDRSGSQVTDNISNEGGKLLSDIVDFTWWSDHILTLSSRSGTVSMLDILSGLKLQKSDPIYSMPVLERAQQIQGNLFLLESISSEERSSPSNYTERKNLFPIEQITEDRFNQCHISRLRWSLISFSERSVHEMYNILISSEKYQTALDFANCHGLDKDEVLKSQWLNSDLGIKEINTFLLYIKDQAFVLSECIDKVGPTEDAVKTLLAYGLRLTSKYGFSELDNDCSQIWDFRMARLKLLQFRDRLETYLGVNMGRFSVQEFSKFRVMPINEAAVTLAESGKIGALNLLFKRHPYSLSSCMLEVLTAIPETVPVQTYGQLLPGRSPPTSMAVREADWVECEKMISFIKKSPENHEIGIQLRTEPIIKQLLDSFWPSSDELSVWYKNRAREIDSFSGLLDNCLCLVDFACHKGICELQQFYEDISYLHQLVYSDDRSGEINFSMSLVAWEQLSDYDKFRSILNGAKAENIVEILHNKAIPFMQKRFHDTSSFSHDQLTDDHRSVASTKAESFLVRWMKEIAFDNKLDICLMVIEEGCREFQQSYMEFKSNGFFKDEVEAVECALQCIYSCTLTDRWSTMAAVLSKLPQMQDTEIWVNNLEKRLKLAEGHTEAGRLLSFYQVPKPLNFFLEAHSDGKGVKQILRLILSKFIRRQPGRSDNDWANMWRDLQLLQEKGFPFLDLEYMLMEFCRGLLRAGKFSLARNYLKGTSSVAMASEKAENLVIQAAKEYLFSASSLTCQEIWKAKECLNLFPNSRNVKAEADIIDALTVKLPNLGVTLLPMQFRQIKNPMEIIEMAITSQAGAYLHVDELIEVAKLLGLNSQDDISSVEEAIAREAAVAGDLQLAFDLSLVLTKKGHGRIWDLCAAIARGPALENMDVNSRKQLLGFALSHCDEESIGELLHAWKDLDMQEQCESLMVEGVKVQDIVDLKDCSELVEGVTSNDQEVDFNNIKNILSVVAQNLPVENGMNWESLLRENGKILSFASLQLPWLLQLSKKAEPSKKLIPGLFPGKKYVSVKTQAVVTILSWLARNGFPPRDNLIAFLAKSIIEPPVTEEEDIIGCSFLLNLVDSFNGVEVIEEQLRVREDYQETCSIMNVGMTYSSLHNSGVECEGSAQRRKLLLTKFKEKHTPPGSDGMDQIDKAQSTFWREWKLKLEEQKRIADHSRALEQIIPGVETARFLSGDFNYIQNVVLSLIESIKLEKKHVLKDVLKVADDYALNRTEILLQYLSSVLVSEAWTNDDITAEISEVKGELIGFAAQTIKAISLMAYPSIDGSNKQRLAYIYGLLYDCYLQLEETKESLPMIHRNAADISSFRLAHFYKVIEQECERVSFIKNLNFKNIAGLGGLNTECFSSEVYAHVSEDSLEALAKMVQTLVSMYTDPVPDRLISWQDVYKHYVLSLLTALEMGAKRDFNIESPENFQFLISQLEQAYNSSRMHIRLLVHSDALDIMKQYFMFIIPLYGSHGIPDNSTWQECLIVLLDFWIRLADEMQEIVLHEGSGENRRCNPECLISCLKVLMKLVMEDSVSPSQGWGTIIGYVNCGLIGNFSVELFIFCRTMVFSGCGFGAVAEVYSEAVSQHQTSSALTCDTEFQDLPRLYINILEPVLQNLVNESNELQNLYTVISSVSKLEGDLDNLKSVRQVVWKRMAKFSENLQLPSHVRVYALELMQYIMDKNIKGSSGELQSNVLPWEGWDEFQCTNESSKITANQGLPNQPDTSNRFTSTLVALKSSQLIGAVSPGLEITPDDLSNVESAFSCFLKLREAANADTHLDALLAILDEWEGLFVSGKDKEASAEASDAGNNWSGDDWDEGWESFQDVEPLEKEKKESSASIHPLHACWMEMFQKLITLSRFRDVLKLIDQSLSKSNGTLLHEDGAWRLSQFILETDCFVAIKMMLLLPYEVIQLHCLDAVEDKLKQGAISDTIIRDHEFLLLVLSSGVISTIIMKPSYGTTFSYLCCIIGNLCRGCQEAQLSRVTQKGRNESEGNEEDSLYLFRRILFPCFISELVKADEQILAGFLVTKFMHTNASFSLINVAEASLRRYLERQLHVLQQDELAPEEMSSRQLLKNTVSSLRDNMRNLIQSAITILSSDLR